MSSFKFLSVSLIVEKAKYDQQIYFLLISSAFCLITTNILQDITESILANTSCNPSVNICENLFLPTSYATAQFLISFANKILELLESISFYIGVLVSLVILFRKIVKKIKEKSNTKELDNREKYYSSFTKS